MSHDHPPDPATGGNTQFLAKIAYLDGQVAAFAEVIAAVQLTVVKLAQSGPPPPDAAASVQARYLMVLGKLAGPALLGLQTALATMAEQAKTERETVRRQMAELERRP